MYSLAERSSEGRRGRASSGKPSSFPTGVYWAMRENSTAPAGKLSAAQSMVALELEKPKADQLAALLLEVENQVSRRLTRDLPRGTRVLRALKACRENAVYRPGAGHTLGWLMTQLF